MSPYFVRIVSISYRNRKGDIETSLLTIEVDFVNHVVQLGFCRVLAERPHHNTELFRRYRAVTILVEQRERLLELCQSRSIVDS